MSALLHVFKLLPNRDRLAAACVCKEWNGVSKHPSLWAKLDLQNNQQASKILSTLPHQYTGPLKEVNLEFAADVTDQDLRKLHGNDLEVLNLNACQRITDAGVIMLVAQSPNLQQLSLYWNVHITDTPLYKVASLCTQLTHLNLSGCKRITDEGLMSVARKCHRLVDVDLTRYCFSQRRPVSTCPVTSCLCLHWSLHRQGILSSFDVMNSQFCTCKAAGLLYTT